MYVHITRLSTHHDIPNSQESNSQNKIFKNLNGISSQQKFFTRIKMRLQPKLSFQLAHVLASDKSHLPMISQLNCVWKSQRNMSQDKNLLKAISLFVKTVLEKLRSLTATSIIS